MSKHRMVVRLNVSALLGALALAGAAGCDSAGDNDEFDERAQVDPSIDAAVRVVDGGIVGGGDPDASDGGPVDSDGGLRTPRILAVTALGTGCPMGSYTAAIAPDGQSVTVSLKQFEAEVSADSTLANKNCQLTIGVTAEKGRQYQLSRSSARGVVALDEGVSARVEVHSYFQGDPTVGDTWRTDLNGPLNEDLVLDTPEPASVWSPCGLDRAVNVNFLSRLSNLSAPQANGYLKIDDVQVFNLASRACP